METVKKYEVIRLLEHNGKCHVSMDHMQGQLLADWLKEAQTKRVEMDKEIFYDWMKQLARQLEQYHRSGRGACYRYLNPYSILIGESGELYLLDLEAEENEFVLKSLQERGMREQFVLPVQQIRDRKPHENKEEVDIYCFGKTIRLLFARTETELRLNRSEKRRLERFLRRCTDIEDSKAYRSLGQMQKEMPRRQRSIEIPYKRKLIISFAVLVIAFMAERVLSIAHTGLVSPKQKEEVTDTKEEQTDAQIPMAERWKRQTDQAIKEIYDRLETLETQKEKAGETLGRSEEEQVEEETTGQPTGQPAEQPAVGQQAGETLGRSAEEKAEEETTGQPAEQPAIEQQAGETLGGSAEERVREETTGQVTEQPAIEQPGGETLGGSAEERVREETTGQATEQPAIGQQAAEPVGVQ